MQMEFSINLNDFQCLQMTEDVSYKSGCLKGAMVLLKSYVQTASTSTLVIVPLLVNQSSLLSCLHTFNKKGIKRIIHLSVNQRAFSAQFTKRIEDELFDEGRSDFVKTSRVNVT